MRTRRPIVATLLVLMALVVLSLMFGHVGAQPSTPTEPLPPATTVPPQASPTPTSAAPAQMATPPLTLTVAPAPEPTLTIPQALDWIRSLAIPALIAIPAALVVFWRKRIARLIDRMMGGQRYDLKEEVERAAQKKKVEDEWKAKQFQATLPAGIVHYLDWLQAEYGSTQPLGIATEQVQLSLDAVHVPLRVVERSAIDVYRRRMQGEDRQTSVQEAANAENRSRYVFELLSEPTLLAARQLPPTNQRRRPVTRPLPTDDDPSPPLTTTRLLLLGDAGSGKTMTLRYAALRLAVAYRRGDASLLVDADGGMQLYLRQPPLPIYVRLTLFAATIPADLHDLPPQERERYTGAPPDLFLKWLDREMVKYCAIQEGVLSSLIMKDDGRVLLLLDGLDEAGDDQRRAYLAQVIDNLARRYAKQRYVVASRTAGYRGGVYLPEFLEQHLSPLDEPAAQAVLSKWFDAVYARLAASGRRRQDAAADQAAQLWGAVKHNDRLLEMAMNPLLLTAMALLQFNSVKLPDQRAKLYEKLIELLLDLWRKQNVANDTLVMSVARLATEQRRLEVLALSMQQQSQQVREVTVSQAQGWLSPLYVQRLKIDRETADERVRDLLHRLAVDSGIIQRREDMYSFSHYTFQEYLAARALDSLDNRDNRDSGPDSVAFLLEYSGNARWRETLLLAAGYWSNGQQLPKTERLLRGLLDMGEPERLLLAAAALADVGVVEELTTLRDEATARLRTLAALTGDWATAAHPDPVLRNRAATMLDRLDADSDRPGLDMTSADYWADRIEPGTFSMGDNNGRFDDEKPQFDYPIRRPYALARFPVTNRQYLLFVEALAGRGTPEAVEAARKLLLLMKQQNQTAEEFRPRLWPGARYRAGEGNHPVVGVTWYAATAFAWWANETLLTPAQRDAGEVIRLPTEAEWERAAAYPLALSGDEPHLGRREYPWGAELTAATTGCITATMQANIDASTIGGTSVAGIFPHGAAACGAEELSGNVREWCSTPYLTYPFSGEVSAESLYTGNKSSNETYVLRGGSWNSSRDCARCAYRLVFPLTASTASAGSVLPVCSPCPSLHVFLVYGLFDIVKGFAQLSG